MSTRTLSALSGIPVDRIEAIEAGIVPHPDELLIMGRYVGIPADRLIEEADFPATDPNGETARKR